MTRVIISGYYGFDNFGDEAILQVLIENLKKNNLEITVISSNPEKTSQTYDINSVYTYNFFETLSAIKKSDVLISGGGSLLQDITSVRSLLYYLFIILIGVLCYKRIIVFAQGIGPIKNTFARALTKNLLKRVDFVSVRDEESKKLLDNWGIKSVQVEDPVWGINIKTSIPKEKVGIQLRGWKYMSDEFFLNLVKVVAKNFENKEIWIYSLQDKQDRDICLRFENYLHIENPKVKTKVFYGMTVKEIIESMQELEYLIAMRYHAIMIGLKYGVKTLSINYDPKVEALSKFANIPCINFNEYNSIELYVEKMKLLSRRMLLLISSKKRFSFRIFEKEINKEI